MLTETYEIKNAGVLYACLDEPKPLYTQISKPEYFIEVQLTDIEVDQISKLMKELAVKRFGHVKGVKGADTDMRFGGHVRPCKTGGSKILARSEERPVIHGASNSKGEKLDLIRKADVVVTLWAYDNTFGKGVNVQLKEVTVKLNDF